MSATLTLCGLTAPSMTALYFAVAKRPDATILRADETETVLEVRQTGATWIFVAKPVAAVLCRTADPPLTESQCDGPAQICGDLVRRLTANPRARP